jgi:hypothetical protein
VRQVLGFNPKVVVILDQSETITPYVFRDEWTRFKFENFRNWWCS